MTPRVNRIIEEMATPTRQIESGGIYHVLNRGVDKKRIFLDDRDRLRFIHDLYEFNDCRTSLNNGRFFTDTNPLNSPGQSTKGWKSQRDPLVDILAFCLMPNHYHLLLKQLSENGLVKFLSKLNTGFAKYFNQRYKRTGTLFQGRFKSIPIVNESHFTHIPYYIHCNPLDLIVSEWRERKISDPKKAINFLSNYRWSSHLDFCGKHNFPSITKRDFLLEIFGGEKKYRQEIEKWICGMNYPEIAVLALE